MNRLTVRSLLISMILAVTFMPLDAHHGSEFLSKALEMNTAQMRMAELATQKAQSSRVKAFAQTLAQNHKQTLERLSELRDARLVDSISPGGELNRSVTKSVADAQPTPEHQRMIEKLSSLSGTDFDREFMDVMVREHRQAIHDFEAQTHAHGNTLTSNKQSSTTESQDIARQKPSPAGPRKYSRDELRRDVDTAEFAAAALPALRQYLEQAEQIQKELGTKY
jgi:predicted outer membrane protein